jgi:predicted DCC family thiol-disulfide oxidoreductase YuxK
MHSEILEERDCSAMPSKPVFPLQIFYDGSCIVCATEIEHYLGRDHGGRLRGVDISSPGFDPEPFRISRAAFMYELHVIDGSGAVYRGIESFWAIWQAFPASSVYGVLGIIITLPLVNPLARLFYKCFARIRPFLPKRRNCDSGVCHIDKKLP